MRLMPGMIAAINILGTQTEAEMTTAEGKSALEKDRDLDLGIDVVTELVVRTVTAVGVATTARIVTVGKIAGIMAVPTLAMDTARLLQLGE